MLFSIFDIPFVLLLLLQLREAVVLWLGPGGRAGRWVR